VGGDGIAGYSLRSTWVTYQRSKQRHGWTDGAGEEVGRIAVGSVIMLAIALYNDLMQ
jgi:hypothetical protein